jgi:hypothetical protein
MEKRIILGEFELDEPRGELHVSNVAREADRTIVNSAADSGYRLDWERTKGKARVYYFPDKKY